MGDEIKAGVGKIAPPPKRPEIKDTRSFAKLTRKVVYLLDGVETNPVQEDSRENYDAAIASYVEAGRPIHVAKTLATQERLQNFGVGMEHGFYGEAVKPWFPGNFAVLIAPIYHDGTLEYYTKNGETPDMTLGRIFLVMKQEADVMMGKEGALQFEHDPLGGRIVPGMGVMYGPTSMNMANLAAFLMSHHGKVVGRDPSGDYVLEKITEEDVHKHMPPGFIDEWVDEEANFKVFDEILTVTTVFNLELIEHELHTTGSLQEDDKKN